MEELEKLHKAVSANMNIGDFEEFSSKMQDTDSRKRFYDAVSKEGFDLGDYNEYESRLSKSGQPTPTEPKGDVAEENGVSVSPSASTEESLSDTNNQNVKTKAAEVDFIGDQLDKQGEPNVEEKVDEELPVDLLHPFLKTERPEIVAEYNQLKETIKNRPVMADNSEELARIGEIEQLSENYSKAPKSTKEIAKEQIQDLDSLILEQEKRADLYSKGSDMSFEEVLNNDGVYQDLKKSRDQVKVNLDRDIKKEAWDKRDLLGDTFKKLKATTSSAIAGIGGIPNYMNKTLFTLIAPQEMIDNVNELSPEDREKMINGVMSSAGGALNGMGQMSADIQKEFLDKADGINAEIAQFETDLTEDLVNGDYGQFSARVLSDGIGSVPSLVQAMIPYVGIGSIMVGSAANKQEELEGEGYGIGLDTSANSAINGVSEGLLEIVTKKLGSKIFKSLKEASPAARKTLFKDLYDNLIKAPLFEGGSEAATSLIQNLSDMYIQGKEKDFNEVFSEVADAFYVGFGMGGGMGMTSQTIQTIKNVKNDVKIENLIKDESNDYNTIKDIFDPSKKDIDVDMAAVVAMGGNLKFDKDIDRAVKEGEMTVGDADGYKTAYNETSLALSKTRGLNLTSDNRVEAMNLIREKDVLKHEIKNMDDALATTKKQRVQLIDEKLVAMTTSKQEVKETEGVEDTPSPTVELDPTNTSTVKNDTKNNIIKNTTEETSRITTLDKEAEDGATLNQDGTKYEGVGLVVPITSKNTTQGELTPEMIADFIEEHSDQIGGDNVKVGIYKFPNSDQVSIDLNVVVDPANKQKALDFAKQAGQESLFDLETGENIKTGADGKNPKSLTPEQIKELTSSDNIENKKIDDTNKKDNTTTSTKKEGEGTKTNKGGKDQGTTKDASSLDKVIDALNKWDKQLKDFQDNTFGINVPVVITRGAVKAMQVAAKTAKTGLEIIEVGNRYVRGTQWYKNLNDSDRKEFDKEGITKTLNTINDPETQYNRNKEAAKKARQEASDSKRTIGEKLKKALSKSFVELIDRQGVVKEALNKMGGDKIVDYIVARAGASSSAKFYSDRIYKTTFNRLSKSEIENLEEIIQLERTIAIDKSREERGLEPLKRQGGMDADAAKIALEGYRSKLGEKTYNKLQERAKNYFDAYKKILSEMKEEGLINQETYDMFAEVNYQPTQYLQFMEDMDGNFLMEELDQAENIPLSQKQIKSSKKGFEGSQVMDAWYLLQRSILTRSKAVFSNRLNRTFVDVFTKTKKEVDQLRIKESRGEKLTKEELTKIKNFENVESKVKLDEIKGFTKTGNPKYALEGKNTKGFSPLYYYIDGVKHRILMEDKFLEQFTDTNNKYLNGKVRENVALVTGTSSVKTLATGNNPLFFITNTPRDFLFTLTLSKEYGNELITNSVKLAADFTKGIRSVIKGDDTFKKFLQYGGGMDYLSVQGKYKSKGLLKDGVDLVMSQRTQDFLTKNKVKTAIDKFNMASEMGMRLAVFNKSIKNQLKDRGIKDIEELSREEKNDVYTAAVRSARELSDFAQGGKTTKALDAAIPYLNAAVQGTRAAASNMKQRPVETMVRMTQAVGYTVGATTTMALSAISYFRDDEDEEVKKMSNAEIYFETLRGVSEYDLQNYFIVPLGYKDDNGEWVYSRIAKAQSLSPLINAAEYGIRKRLAKESGVLYDQNLGRILKNTTENNILPIKLNPIDVVASTPIGNATLAWYGIDGYTGNPLSWDRGRIPKELEGLVDDRVEPMFKEMGTSLNVSPVRLQEVTEAYITTPSTNPYVGMMYGLGNYVSSDVTAEETTDNLKKEMKKSFTNRMIKSTSQYNKITKIKENVSKEVIEIYRENILLEDESREIIRKYKKDKDKDVLKKDIKDLVKSKPKKSKQIMKWFDSEINKKSLSPLVSSLKFEPNKEVRALILAERYGNSLLNHRSLKDNDKKVFGSLIKEKVLDTETYRHYMKLVKTKKDE